jgi:hypothetical protein
MKSYRTKRILHIGDMYMNGRILNIQSEDYGWILTLRYLKGIKKIFVYHH